MEGVEVDVEFGGKLLVDWFGGVVVYAVAEHDGPCLLEEGFLDEVFFEFGVLVYFFEIFETFFEHGGGEVDFDVVMVYEYVGFVELLPDEGV